jgi:hypothetical protein
MFRILKLVFTFLIIITHTSCSFIIKKAIGLKNPKVETRQSLTDHLIKNNINLGNNYFFKLKKDSTEIYKTILDGLKKNLLIFDKQGKKCCYMGSEKCKGKQLSKTIMQFDTFYKPCINNDSMTLTQLREGLVSFSTDQSKLDPDYYIVIFWNKYLGKKNSIREDYEWIYELKNKSNVNLEILFINTDLQEEWGLIKGRRMKIKFHLRSKNSASIQLGKIPYK